MKEVTSRTNGHRIESVVNGVGEAGFHPDKSKGTFLCVCVFGYLWLTKDLNVKRKTLETHKRTLRTWLSRRHHHRR